MGVSSRLQDRDLEELRGSAAGQSQEDVMLPSLSVLNYALSSPPPLSDESDHKESAESQAEESQTGNSGESHSHWGWSSEGQKILKLISSSYVCSSGR